MKPARNAFNRIEGWFQPDETYRPFRVDQRFLANLVGAIAVLLPVVMLLGVAVGGVCFYDSISHFYYAELFGDIFVGALVAIGVFLLAYRAPNRWESRLAWAAGIAALGIALFPTNGAGCGETPFAGRAFVEMVPAAGDSAAFAEGAAPSFEPSSHASVAHFSSAALLFVFLAIYSFFVFTRVVDGIHRDREGGLVRPKKLRNRIYRTSGIAIAVSILAIAGKAVFGEEWSWWEDRNATFVLETVALWAFGFSWIVKGRAFGLRDPGE